MVKRNATKINPNDKLDDLQLKEISRKNDRCGVLDIRIKAFEFGYCLFIFKIVTEHCLFIIFKIRPRILHC